MVHLVSRAPHLLPALVLACGPDEPLDIVFRGEHVEYSVIKSDVRASQATLCGGSAAYLDAYAGVLKRRLGVDESALIEYTWVPGGVESIGACESVGMAFGCASDGRIVAELPASEHELVHAVRQLGQQRGHPFLEEGLAEFLGGSYPLGRTPNRSELQSAIESIAEGDAWNTEQLAVAGHFVSFLIGTMGLTVGDLDTLTDSGQELLTAAAALAGMDERTLVELYEAHPRLPNIHFRDGSSSCEVAPRAEPVGASTLIHVGDSFGCLDPSSVGAAKLYVERAYVFDVPESGCYGVEWSSVSPSTKAWLEDCDGDIARTNVLLGFPSALLLDKGEHRLAVRAMDGVASETFSFRLELEASREPADCY